MSFTKQIIDDTEGVKEAPNDLFQNVVIEETKNRDRNASLPPQKRFDNLVQKFYDTKIKAIEENYNIVSEVIKTNNMQHPINYLIEKI